MTIEMLKSSLSRFVGDDVGAEFYFILKNGQGAEVKFADIDSSAQEKLKMQFGRHILESLVENDNISLVDLSSADERRNAIYRYDLEEIPSELSHLEEILASQDLPMFLFDTDSMSDIKGILVRIGRDDQQLALYKKNYPVSLIQKESSKTLMLRRNNRRFSELDSDILKINPRFEFFKLNGEIYIIDLESLEKFFGFTEIIIREATRSVAAISDSGLVENPEFLAGQISDISFSRKLTKVLANSPVLNIVPNDIILSFVNSHPSLRGKLRTNAGGDRLLLHSKQSRNLLIKLLNDDYLSSELTHRYYESLAKDSLDED